MALRNLVLLFVLAVAAGACRQPQAGKARPAASTAAPAAEGPLTPAELEAFAALGPIDTHSHVDVPDPAFVAMLERLNVHLLDICLNDDRNPPLANLLLEIHRAEAFIKASAGHATLCMSFDPFLFGRPGFAQAAIRQINRNFVQGAIAVKIWKNIGVEIKDGRGRYIMPDNPVFDPIYRDIAAQNMTLIAHLAEPDSCWAPLEPASPDYWYYSQHPEWHMYGKPGAPSKAEILRARDHLLEENPTLRVVGAHLGSMESNFDLLGRHLDRYPNFAVDMAARMPYIVMLPRARATAFMTKYQDRLIYGTDLDYMTPPREGLSLVPPGFGLRHCYAGSLYRADRIEFRFLSYRRDLLPTKRLLTDWPFTSCCSPPCPAGAGRRSCSRLQVASGQARADAFRTRSHPRA